MEKTETLVAAHYTTEDLLGRIARALTEVGADPANLRPDDLKPVDEFHTGGLEATKALLDQLQIDAETRVLDIGSGLGGTARFVTETYGAGVVGVDLTPVFVETALELSRMVGLEDQVTYLTGSATALPLEPDSVDLALMFHVGMNIAD
ncbi:MAG: methyltransferase domain-containing protein, partial [Pseudomonadota bacterium]